jgi:hypothetical protein
VNSKGVSQHSSDHKKLAERKLVEGGGSTENLLSSIAEVDLQDPEPVPSTSFNNPLGTRVTEESSCCHRRKSRCRQDLL